MQRERVEMMSGTKHFMNVDLETAPGVLLPREETELLGRTVLDILERRPGPQRVVDMCCGSGNLACAVAVHLSRISVWASDLTDNAVALARRNADRLNLTDRMRVFQGDLFSALPVEELGGQVDLVMCNPPYISTSRLEGEKAHLLDAEPREAFDGGPYGLSLHQRVIRESLEFLKPDGWIALEFGEGQEKQIASLFRRSGGYRDVELIGKEAGAPRVAIAQRNR